MGEVRKGLEKRMNLEWRGLSFDVKRGKQDLQILHNNWGTLPGSTLTALLGVSGSGKSSILNILSGRMGQKKNVFIDAEIRVDGLLIDPVSYRRNVAFVMQDECLLKTATPREALFFSARLRLGNAKGKKELSKITEDMLSKLGLEDCADTQIGDALKYTLNLLLLIEFTGHSCNDSPQASTNCESILTRNNISSSDIGLYIGIIAAIFVGLRIVGALLLKQRASTYFERSRGVA